MANVLNLFRAVVAVTKRKPNGVVVNCGNYLVHLPLDFSEMTFSVHNTWEEAYPAVRRPDCLLPNALVVISLYKKNRRFIEHIGQGMRPENRQNQPVDFAYLLKVQLRLAARHEENVSRLVLRKPSQKRCAVRCQDQRDVRPTEGLRHEPGKAILEIGVKVHVRFVDEQHVLFVRCALVLEGKAFNGQRDQFSFSATECLPGGWFTGVSIYDLELVRVVSFDPNPFEQFVYRNKLGVKGARGIPGQHVVALDPRENKQLKTAKQSHALLAEIL